MNLPIVYQRLKAPNDANGNARRLLVIYSLDNGDPSAIVEEGPGGAYGARHTAGIADKAAVQLPDVRISATEFRSWKREHAAVLKR